MGPLVEDGASRKAGDRPFLRIADRMCGGQEWGEQV